MGTHPIFESDFDCLTEMSRYIDRRNNNFKPVEPIYFSLKGQIEVKISQVKDFLNDCGHIQTFETIQNDAKLFYGKVIFLSDKVFFLSFWLETLGELSGYVKGCS